MAAKSEHEIALDALIVADPAQFDRLLEGALASVRGVVRDAIHRTLGSHFAAQPESVHENIDDLSSETALVLVRKLRELRQDTSLEPIKNFSAYAATVASNVCYGYLRRRYPAWTRLKNQVRYVIAHDPELELREMRNGFYVCASLAPETDGDECDVDLQSMSLGELIQVVLRKSQTPVELNTIVSSIAEIRGIRDGGPSSATISIDALGDRVADPRPAASADDAAFLKRVWEEVQKLPLRQRVALLLNSRDNAGRSVLALFPLTATASVLQIAETLETSSEELARIWNDLPLDDLKIAKRLGIARQQVINLRKAARARLARRLAEWRC